MCVKRDRLQAHQLARAKNVRLLGARRRPHTIRVISLANNVDVAKRRQRLVTQRLALIRHVAFDDKPEPTALQAWHFA